MTIVEECLNAFAGGLHHTLNFDGIIYRLADDPVEFVYDGLSIMCAPELAVMTDKRLEVLTFKTGSDRFRDSKDAYLRCGAFTCWGRKVLKCVDCKIVDREVFLREGCIDYETHLNDDELGCFLATAREVAGSYSSSAKIRDFPAKPSSNSCRFCDFQKICPEYLAHFEQDYAVPTLRQALQSHESGEEGEEPNETETIDVFLSHVSEDKEQYVRPFARALKAEGITYWLDEAELLWGDSLTRSINAGLRDSRYVICFVSPSFVKRGWPEAELSSAFAKELEEKRTRVLPLMIADLEEFKLDYPLLNAKVYKRWEEGIPTLVKHLKARLQR